MVYPILSDSVMKPFLAAQCQTTAPLMDHTLPLLVLSCFLSTVMLLIPLPILAAKKSLYASNP